VATITGDRVTGDITVTWPSRKGCKFSVLWTDDLSAPIASWLAAPGGNMIEDTTEDGNTESFTDLGISIDPNYPTGYYVVQLLN
jgi:hypothetical protein